MYLAGRPLAHVVMMMIPEPWSNHESMDDEKTRQEVETVLGITGSPLPTGATQAARQPTLHHLADQLFTLSRTDPIPNDGALTLKEAPDHAAEVRTALRWLKQQIVWGGVTPDQVALLARDIGPYRLCWQPCSSVLISEG